MRAKIVIGIALILVGLALQYLTLFGYLNDCAPRYDYAPVNRVCVPAAYLNAISIIQICVIVAGGALVTRHEVKNSQNAPVKVARLEPLERERSGWGEIRTLDHLCVRQVS